MHYIELREAIDLISGRDLKKSECNANGSGIPYIMGASNIQNGKFIIERWTETPEVIGLKGDIVLSVKGTIGAFFVLEEEKAHLSRQVMALRAKSGYLNEYIKYFLSFYVEQLKAKAKGIIPGIKREDILTALIPKFNIDEQQRIVDIIKKSEQILFKKEKQILMLDRLIENIFLQIFGDPINNPNNWVKKTCKVISSKIGSGATPRGGSSSYKDSGTSLIRSMNVYNNKFNYKDLAYIDEQQSEKLRNVEVFEQDILLNITGASVARSCIVPKDVLPARVNQHVAIIRTLPNVVDPHFLNYQLTNKSYQEYLLRVAKSGGATREAITKAQIEKLEIIVPPFEVQTNFTNLLNRIERKKNIAIKSNIQLNKLYNSLVQKAFKGELFQNQI